MAFDTHNIEALNSKYMILQNLGCTVEVPIDLRLLFLPYMTTHHLHTSSEPWYHIDACLTPKNLSQNAYSKSLFTSGSLNIDGGDAICAMVRGRTLC